MAGSAAGTATVEDVPFSQRLRTETWPIHERARDTPYMGALMGERLGLGGYARLVVQYFHIYRALEEAGDSMRGDEVGGRFVYDELRRLPALRADLGYLFGPGWRRELEPCDATADYVRRMRSVAFDWPGGYVAHHYTRYLGDLAGGQAIRRLLERFYGVTGDGNRFYRFEGVRSAPAFRDAYRAQLDAAPWGPDERRQIIDETWLAFELNIAVFDELSQGMDRYAVADGG